MVQADPHESLSIFFQCEFSHGKITCYPVFLHLNSKIIKIRCITCPHLHILNRNLQPFIRLSIKCSYGSFCCTFHRICYSAPGHVLHWIIRYIFLQLFVDLWLLQHNLYSIFCTRPDYDTDFFLIRFRERLHFFYILFRDSFQSARFRSVRYRTCRLFPASAFPWNDTMYHSGLSQPQPDHFLLPALPL